MGTFVGADAAGGTNIQVLTDSAWPAGVLTGDIALFPWGLVNTATPTDPTSDTFSLLTDTIDGSARVRCLYRYCNGTESGAISGWDAGLLNRQAAVLAVFRGYDFISGLAVRQETTTGTSHANPQVTTLTGFGGNTPADGDTIVIIVVDRDGTTTSVTAPAGYAKRTGTEIGVVGSGGVHVAVADDGLTDSVTLPHTPAAWTGFAVSSGTAITITVALRPSATAVDLTVANATQAHAADTPALTQVHSLTVAGATQGHSAQGPMLTQTHELSVAGATQSHTAESPTLTQAYNLTVAGATQGQTADSVALTQLHTLAVANAVQAHTSAQVILSVTSDLIVDGAVQAHTSSTVSLTQEHVLAVDSTLHLHTASMVTIVPVVAREDLTVTVGPTRVSSLSVGSTRQALTVGDTRDNAAGVAATRSSTSIGPTRRDRGA